MALSRVKSWADGEVLTASDLNAEFNNILNNASSLISPLSGALDWDGYAHTLDAVGVTTAQSTSSTGWSFIPGSKAGTPGATGSVTNWAANTYTDNATAGSGTATTWTGHSFQRPTLAATNSSVTTTNAATVYVANSPLAGTNETLTNAWSAWVDDGPVRLDGDLHVQGSIHGTVNKYSLAASVSSNALTIAFKDEAGNDASTSKPITLKFRSATVSTGTFTLGTVSAALSTVVSSGSTLGTANSVAHRIHIGALLSGSTVELCYWNSQSTSGLVTFLDTDLITTTAEGGAGAADSAGVMYSTTARSGVPWIYLGYLESTQATAGTWASSPSKIQTKGESTPLPGQIVKSLYSADGALATGTTTVPFDDTIPQNTEGDQYLSLAITPTSAINYLDVSVQAVVICGQGGNTAVCLFQDTTANALAVNWNPQAVAANGDAQQTLRYRTLAGTTSSTTFKVRAGSSAGGTTNFNGTGAARKYGGVLNSWIAITELHA
jgi:hypothetical protein